MKQLAIKKHVGLRDVVFRIFLGGQFLTSQQENSTNKTLSKLFQNQHFFRQATSGDPISGGSRVPSSIQLLSAEMLDISDEYKKHKL